MWKLPAKQLQYERNGILANTDGMVMHLWQQRVKTLHRLPDHQTDSHCDAIMFLMQLKHKYGVSLSVLNYIYTNNKLASI